ARRGDQSVHTRGAGELEPVDPQQLQLPAHQHTPHCPLGARSDHQIRLPAPAQVCVVLCCVVLCCAVLCCVVLCGASVLVLSCPPALAAYSHPQIVKTFEWKETVVFVTKMLLVGPSVKCDLFY